MSLADDQLALLDHRDNVLPEFIPTTHTSRERELREMLVDIVHRACQRQLMISTEGVASARA